MQELATNVAGFPLRLRWLRMGADLCLTLSGGEQEHIGAVAVAQPRPSLADPTRTSATASVITLAGHKEDMLAREIALNVASTLNIVACVACGIHVRHPTPDMLEELVAASHGLVDAFLAEMQNTAKSSFIQAGVASSRRASSPDADSDTEPRTAGRASAR